GSAGYRRPSAPAPGRCHSMRALSIPPVDTLLLFHVRHSAVRRPLIQPGPSDDISIEVVPRRRFLRSLPESSSQPMEGSSTANPQHGDVLPAEPIFRSPVRPIRKLSVRARFDELSPQAEPL